MHLILLSTIRSGSGFPRKRDGEVVELVNKSCRRCSKVLPRGKDRIAAGILSRFVRLEWRDASCCGWPLAGI